VFSRRTGWGTTLNRFARALEEIRGSGRPVLDLTETNPTQVGLPMPEAEILAALSDRGVLSYEPLPFGHAAARSAVSAYHGGAVPPEHIVLTASTSDAYGTLFKLVANPGDRILVPVPSYPLFEYLAGLENVETVPYLCAWEDDGWLIDFASLEEGLDARTRAIVVVSPNNPTGAMLRKHEADRLLELCRDRGLALIADEVFRDHVFADAPDLLHSLAGREEALVFVLAGLSKTCLLPQLKAAWIAVSGPRGLAGEALGRLEIIADTYLSVNTLVQLALPQLLALREVIRTPLMARLAANRSALARALAGSAATLLPSHGGWSAVVRVPRHPGEEERALRLLTRHQVRVHPGFFFDFPTEAFLVVSMLGPEDELARGAAILAADADDAS
jgi:aspartate/methionine/tyrosine aminotransferase